MNDHSTGIFIKQNFVRQLYVHLTKDFYCMAKRVKWTRLGAKKTQGAVGTENPRGKAPAVVKAKEPESEKKAEDPMIEYVSTSPEENKSQRLELRLTKRQKDFISKASSVSGFKNVSDYILHIAINDSKNVIREQQLFELSGRDRVSFMKTLENSPEPGNNLKKAKSNYLSFQKGK